MKNDGSITIKIKNEVSEIAPLRDRIGEFCSGVGMPAKAVNNVKLAIDEILTNVISYAFRDSGAHEITVRAGLEAARLHIEIEDDGWQFNPLSLPDPDIEKPIEERQIGGLGVFLVRRIMDGVEYRRENEKNILIMKKNIPLSQ